MAAITVLDTAIQTVNTQRSKLGAVSNRLTHTVNNLTNISANLSAARGGIEDADFAFETTQPAKNQILLPNVCREWPKAHKIVGKINLNILFY
jgi:flagellin